MKAQEVDPHATAPAGLAGDGLPATDEALVRDLRGSMTPAQMVENKLVSLLKATPLPMSRLQARPVERPRP